MRKNWFSANHILVAVLAGAFTLYLFAITPANFGFYHDDALYVVSAKALATGQGYRVISLPGDPVQTKSPPVYPFLLSLIWRIHPSFPENVKAMMVLSVLATFASLIIAWAYLTRRGYASRPLATCVVVLTALNWRTLVVGTGLFSEMFYTALSIAALYLAERYDSAGGKWLTGAGLGILMGLAFLTRTTGVALLIAVAAFLVMRRRARRDLLPIAIAGCFVLAWVGWSYANRPVTEGLNTAYHESYIQTFDRVLTEFQSHNHLSRASALVSVVGRNAWRLIPISIPLVCLGMKYDWPASLGAYWFLPVVGLIFFVFVLTVAAFFRLFRGGLKGLRLLPIYVTVYLILHLAWPYYGHDRFLIPLLPFLLAFLIGEQERLRGMVVTEMAERKDITRMISAGVIGLAMLSIASVGLYNYGLGLKRSLVETKRNAAIRRSEDLEAIHWINANTDPSDVLVCARDPMYYLYTGRQATMSSSLTEGGKMDHDAIDADERSSEILRIVYENRARYLILTSSELDFPDQSDPYHIALETLTERNAGVFVPVFRSSIGKGVIYRIGLELR